MTGHDADGIGREDLLVRMIGEAGASLPASEQSGAIKAQVIERVTGVRAGLHEGGSALPARRRYLPAAASVAIALVFAMVVFTCIGVASIHAMPGNPLYSVKRTMERGRLALSSGEDEAEILLRQASERMSEIGYARSRGMKGWLVPLVDDARSSIGKAESEVSGESESVRRRIALEGAGLVVEHEEELRGSATLMPYPVEQDTMLWIDEEVRELEIPTPETREQGDRGDDGAVIEQESRPGEPETPDVRREEDPEVESEPEEPDGGKGGRSGGDVYEPAEGDRKGSRESAPSCGTDEAGAQEASCPEDTRRAGDEDVRSPRYRVPAEQTE